MPGRSYGTNVRLERRIKMDLVKVLSEQYMKPELPEMNVGDTVRVTVRVQEGNRERTQAC
jgi:ribosomal protein L19